ncbi:MAG: multidrug transporter [Bacteroidales bacterium]|nr:multidrug transporter [Bacteroidales bacterium]
MRDELSSYYEDPEFKELLAQYEGMAESHTPAYFDADDLVTIAEYYTSQERYKEADEAIDLALRLHPDNTNALIFRSHTLAMEGRLEEAKIVSDLITDTSSIEAKFLKASLLMEENRMEEVEEIYQQIAESEDNDLDTLLDIVLNYVEGGLEKYAEKWVNRIAEVYDWDMLIKEDLQVMDTMANYYLTFYKPNMAYPILQAILEKKPYSVFHWIQTGRCLLLLYKIAEAHEALDFALAIDENNEEAMILKAFAYKQGNNNEETIALCQKILEKGKVKKLQACLMIVQVYLDMQEYQTCIDCILKVLDETPNIDALTRNELYFRLALAYAGLGQKYEGIKYLAKIKASEEGDYIENLIRTGEFYLKCKEEAKAIEIFDLALEETPEEERYYTLTDIATTCFDARQFSISAQYYERINIDYPKQERANYVFLMYCYFYLVQQEPCLHYLAKIRRDMPETYAMLGTTDGFIMDAKFQTFLYEMKHQIEIGNIDIDKYL